MEDFSFLKSGWLLRAARISSAFIDRVSTPLSSSTRRIPFGIPKEKFIDWGFPPHHPSRITRCLPPGFTFILFTSKASWGIAAWQLLWSKIKTTRHPSALGYFASAIFTACLSWAINFSDVQYPSRPSPYSNSCRACLRIVGSLSLARACSSSVSCKYPLCSSIKSETIIPAPFDFGLITVVPFSAQRVGWSSFDWNVDSSWKRTTVFSATSGKGARMSLGSAFFASSVGALLSLRNPRETILRRNVLR